MNTPKLDLTEWDTRLVLKALRELEAEWEIISRTSLDDDEQAEYGKDLMILINNKEKIAAAAKLVFGESIMTYDRAHLGQRMRNGIPLLPVQPCSRQVTSDFVKQLAEELD